jgi:hypothetical protein
MGGRRSSCCTCRAYSVCHSGQPGKLRKRVHGDWGQGLQSVLDPLSPSLFPTVLTFLKMGIREKDQEKYGGGFWHWILH